MARMGCMDMQATYPKINQNRRTLYIDIKTKDFQSKAANFIANNIRLAQGASVIQCNLLEEMVVKDTVQQKVCKFCNCVLAESCHPRLVPRKAPGTRVKKLLIRAQAMDNHARRVHFSKFEQSLIKKCKSTPANTLVLACTVCRKSQKCPLKPCYRPPKEPKKLIQTEEKTSKNKKKLRKKGAKLNAGLKLVTTTKTNPQNLTSKTMSSVHEMKSSKVTLPEKAMPESSVKLNATKQKNVNNPLNKVKEKVEKTKGTPDFLKKLKKGSKLAGLIAQDAASKKDQKNNPKSSIFALLHGWVGK